MTYVPKIRRPLQKPPGKTKARKMELPKIRRRRLCRPAGGRAGRGGRPSENRPGSGQFDRNERRNITKGQKAMAYASLFPEGKRTGRGYKVPQSPRDFGETLLVQARAILRHTPELAAKVRDGFADRNERRNITVGQKAMGYARLFPNPEKGGRGRKASPSEGFSATLLSRARAVLDFSPEWARLDSAACKASIIWTIVPNVRTRSAPR
jgi:hypothetical protein